MEEVTKLFPDKKNSIMKDLYVKSYDNVYRLMPFRKLMWDIYESLDVKPGMKILDAGCGTGNFESFIFSKITFPLEIESIDNSTSMVLKAQEKCKNFAKVDFKIADLNQRLNYPDCTFDRVVSIDTLGSLENPYITIRELLRVLKPNGKLLISDSFLNDRAFPILFEHIKRIKNIRNFQRKISAFGNLFRGLPVFNSNFRNKSKISVYKKTEKYNYFNENSIKEVLKKVTFQDADFTQARANQSWIASLNKINLTSPILKVQTEKIIKNKWEQEILSEIYHKSFKNTDEECICKQSYTPKEIDLILKDPKVLKLILNNSNGYILGFGLLTNDLKKVPWISLSYLKNNFPEYFFNQKIYCVSSYAIDSKFRGMQAAKKLLGTMIDTVPKDSVCIFDISERVNGLMPKLAQKAASSPIKQYDDKPLDRQIYYLFQWNSEPSPEKKIKDIPEPGKTEKILRRIK